MAHVLVDVARQRVRASGTVLRTDIHAHRGLVHPAVYASFVERIAILGGESSGKSTLAQALAAHFGTAFVAEYGRIYWEAKAGQLAFEDMLHIAETQVELEERALRHSVRYLFCDTTPLTTAHYSRVLFDEVDARLVELAERPYHLTILCEPDVPFVQDGTRRDADFRQHQHKTYLDALRSRGITFLTVRGSVAERVAAVAAVLSETIQCEGRVTDPYRSEASDCSEVGERGSSEADERADERRFAKERRSV